MSTNQRSQEIGGTLTNPDSIQSAQGPENVKGLAFRAHNPRRYHRLKRQALKEIRQALLHPY